MNVRLALLALTIFPLIAMPKLLFAQPLRHSMQDARNQMVDEEIVAAGVKDPRVIQAMRATPRHEFVTRDQLRFAYFDMALPIGEKQTISAPFIVAYMTEQLDPQPTDKVLEIGTGSGYQAAVLSPLVKEVYSIEIVEELGKNAARTLDRLNYENVFTKVGDGYQGWSEHAPFDKIIVTCSPEKVPPALVEQLAEGGRMVIPVGERYQQSLVLLTKKNGKLESEALLPTLFVPMTGKAEQGREVLPDPENPQLVNGSFEEIDAETRLPVGWHHPRQVQVVEDSTAPQGTYYLEFSNQEAGRGSRALQAFAIDGRKVRELGLSVFVAAEGVRPGQNREQMPMLAFMFYDQDRRPMGNPTIVGPWRGSFQWQRQRARIAVPIQAREAILHIGLFGATGTLKLDNLEMTPGAR